MWNGREFGRKLREARRRRGFTQQQLHETANISERAVRYLEAGQGVPSVMTIYKLAFGLDVPVNELLPNGPTQVAE